MEIELILNNFKIKLNKIGLPKQVYYFNLVLHYLTISARDPSYDQVTLMKRLTWINEIAHILSGMIIYKLGKDDQTLDLTVIDEIRDKSIYYECQKEFDLALMKVDKFLDDHTSSLEV